MLASRCAPLGAGRIGKRDRADREFQIDPVGMPPSDVNDPSATLAVHCGNDFDGGFSLYQSTRLSR
jgi:hypothetical protein